MAMAMIRVKKYVNTRYIAVLLCLAASVSPVNCDHHHHHHHTNPLSAKVQVVHPFQHLVLRATDISPIVFYGDNGRVHMEYRPILPKFLFTVSVLGELMRGVGATVNEVLHRASVVYPVHQYGTLQSPYYSYTYPFQKESSVQHHQHSATSNHHPEQRSRDDNSTNLSNSTNSTNSTTKASSESSTPTPVQLTLSSQIRNKYVRPPLMVPTPPSLPQQNILEVISKAINGAK